MWFQGKKNYNGLEKKGNTIYVGRWENDNKKGFGARYNTADGKVQV
jgi:hypothetical protein